MKRNSEQRRKQRRLVLAATSALELLEALLEADPAAEGDWFATASALKLALIEWSDEPALAERLPAQAHRQEGNHG